MMEGYHYELSDQVCEQIYRKVDLEYTKEDAFIRLVNEGKLPDIDNDSELNAYIESKYHITLDAMLEELAQMFYDWQDCEVPDNQTWRNVINMWLEECSISISQSKDY